MAFNRNELFNISNSLNTDGSQWLYNTADDNAAAVVASGYFNDVAQLFQEGQLISAKCSDAHKLLLVSSAAGVTPVTVTDYVPA